MSSLSVDGLVSGLDTSSLIRQLMQLERQPQLRLQSRRDAMQKVVELYRQMNTKFAAVETASDALSDTADWNLSKATSSDPAVAGVTGTPTAPTSSLAFTVTALAQAHSVIGANAVADTDTTVVATEPFTIGSTTISSYGNGTLTDVASAINGSAAGVAAAIVQVSPGQYKLQLTAKQTGAASSFTVSGLAPLGSFGVVTQASDATLTVGTGPGQYTMTSATGTFTGAVAGVTITAKALGSATVSVERDSAGLADKVDALVKSVNDATALIRTNATYDTTTKKTGLLLSDNGADRLRRSLTGAVTGAAIGGLTASSAGITSDKNGVLTFDRSKFLATLETNPDGVKALFTSGGAGTADDGIAERLRLAADTATTYGTGQIATAISQREDSVKTLNSQIAAFDTRLALREKALKRQFSGLETALSTLRNQGSWLAGAINSLPGYDR